MMIRINCYTVVHMARKTCKFRNFFFKSQEEFLLKLFKNYVLYVVVYSSFLCYVSVVVAAMCVYFLEVLGFIHCGR
jgi:hypothetical protein